VEAEVTHWLGSLSYAFLDDPSARSGSGLLLQGGFFAVNPPLAVGRTILRASFSTNQSARPQCKRVSRGDISRAIAALRANVASNQRLRLFGPMTITTLLRRSYSRPIRWIAANIMSASSTAVSQCLSSWAQAALG
jgi:hypothetical protein